MKSNSKLDEQFLVYTLEIEKIYKKCNRHEQIRVEQWCRKLCQVTSNDVWKKNRNLYALLLLNYLRNGKLEKPFTELPPEGSLPVIPSQDVKVKLNSNFVALKQALDQETINEKLEELAQRIRCPSRPRSSESSPFCIRKPADKSVLVSVNTSINAGYSCSKKMKSERVNQSFVVHPGNARKIKSSRINCYYGRSSVVSACKENDESEVKSLQSKVEEQEKTIQRQKEEIAKLAIMLEQVKSENLELKIRLMSSRNSTEYSFHNI